MNDTGIFKKGFTLAVLSAVLWGLFGTDGGKWYQ